MTFRNILVSIQWALSCVGGTWYNLVSYPFPPNLNTSGPSPFFFFAKL